jgi:hypothetical protein
MAKSAKKPPPDDAEQSERFLALAKEVGADRVSPDFEKTFDKLVKAPAGHPEKGASAGGKKS